MRLITSLIKDFLPSYTLTDEEVAERLTALGHETEHISPGALEVKIFPNRGDCLSVYGLARELAAHHDDVGKLADLTGIELPKATNFYPLMISEKAKPLIIADHLLLIENYTATQSPPEVAAELKAIGLQPKDLLVDLTNLITYRLGIPLHVFDYEKIKAGLEIDLTTSEEKITLLNGKTQLLEKGLLVQRSSGRLVDLMGVMGGAESALSAETQTVIVQAAVVEPSAVRNSSRMIDLTTEASYRYQRGVDPGLCRIALERFACGAQGCSTVKFAAYQPYEAPLPQISVSVEPEQVSRLLGIHVSTANLQSLERQGFTYREGQLGVPTWRQDVRLIADVAEEVARVVGLNAIPPQELSRQKATTTGKYHLLTSLKARLSGTGLTETSTYSFTQKGPLSLQNPRSTEQAAMRPSLKEGLLLTLAKNPYLRRVAFYEVGNVFTPEEELKVGIIAAGYKDGPIADLSTKLGTATGLSWNFAQLTQAELDSYDVKQPKVWFAETAIETLSLKRLKIPVNLGPYRKISKFPPVVRDVTLVVSIDVDHGTIAAALREGRSVLIAELVDQFESAEKLGAGKQALTFRILFQDLTKSLTDEEATEALDEIFHNLKKSVEFEVR